MKTTFLLFLASFSFAANCSVGDALYTIRPGSQWVVHGNTYAGMVWLSTTTEPTSTEITAAIAACQANQTTLASQLQNDIATLNSTTTAVPAKVQAITDVLKQKGLLQ